MLELWGIFRSVYLINLIMAGFEKRGNKIVT